MKIILTGACGFVGSTLARLWASQGQHDILGLDSLIRPGSEYNRRLLQKAGVRVLHADIRQRSDLDSLPTADAIIDAAANPSVLAGVDGKSSSRQLVEHNLQGTLNLLEYCRQNSAAFVMLSTSRVYNIPALLNIPIHQEGNGYTIDAARCDQPGLSPAGIAEDFPAGAPCSLYGATKLASEQMALEYGQTFGFPVWINRCGVLAGAGQFGKADQGIFSFWIHSWLAGAPLKYIGFDGLGRQVRDCMHPADLLPLIDQQLANPHPDWPAVDRIINIAGGIDSAMSLAQLSAWCEAHLGVQRSIPSDLTPRPFDIPWVVLDARKAKGLWQWQPQRSTLAILDEIASHARSNPHWLDISKDA